MKRVLVVLLALFVPTLSIAAARTASVDGLWSATATWGGSSVPTSADTCTINSGIEVICDASPCTCFNLTISGGVSMQSGVRSLVIGDHSTTADSGDITINSGGFLQGSEDHTIEIDVIRTSGTRGTITNNGVFNFSGKVIHSGGTIRSFGAISGNAPARVQTLTVQPPQPSLDYWNGKVLVPRSGWFKGQWFDITTGATTLNEVVVSVDTRGAVDSRNKTGRIDPTAWAPGDWGMIYSTGNATVASGATTVTFSTAFSSTGRAEEVLIGSKFACAADVNAADDTDFRTFCSVTSTTVAELCSTYDTASCAVAAAFRVYDLNQPPYPVSIIESFSAGDTFDIIDPAIITIPSANRSDTDMDDNMNIVSGSGSVTILHNTEIGYCGTNRTGATKTDCLVVSGVDNSLSTERLDIDTVDMHHYSGQFGLLIQDGANITIQDLTIRDAGEGGANDGGEAHASGLIDTSGDASRMSAIIFDGLRVVRGNDDCWSWSSFETDGVICSDCKVRNSMCGFTPANDGGSVEGFEPTDVLTDFVMENTLITNVQGDLVNFAGTTTTDDLSATFRHNVLINSQIGSGIDGGPTGVAQSIPEADNDLWIVDNYIAGVRVLGTQRGRLYSNFIDHKNLAPSTSATCINHAQFAYGNTCIGPRRPVNNTTAAFNAQSVGSDTALGSAPVYRDNVAVANSDAATSGTSYVIGMPLISTLSPTTTVTIDHFTALCHDTLNGTSVVSGARPNPSNGSTVAFSNGIFFDCQTGVNESAQSGSGDSTSSYNLFLRVGTALSNATDLGNGLTTGTLGVTNLYSGDASFWKGSTPWTSLGSDGTVRGARVAGPPGGPESFRKIYPFLPDFPVVNNTSDTDTDGDGVWNLHDNCDLTPNPAQYDSDSDGKGCACDASGDTCP